MPTYQYACTSCGEELEVVQKFTDDPLTVCPSCSGALRKVFTAVGVVFKGSGFYKTDSRSASKTSAAASSSTKESATTSDSGASSESSSPASPAAPAPDSGGSSSKTTGSGGERVA